MSAEAPRPEGVTPDDIAGLRDSTDRLAVSIGKMATRDELDAETAEREKQLAQKESKHRVDHLVDAAKLALVVAVVIALIGVYTGWRGKQDAAEAKAIAAEAKVTLNIFLQNRTEARRVACADANTIIEAHNVLVQASIDERREIIEKTAASETTSAEQKAASISFFTDQINRYTNSLVQLRDCSSDEAIDAYYGQKHG